MGSSVQELNGRQQLDGGVKGVSMVRKSEFKGNAGQSINAILRV